MAGAGSGRWTVDGNENIILKCLKVLVIGDPCVGKTSYVQRYVNGTFHRNYKGTIGVDFALKIMRWSDAERGGAPGTVKVQLWDIAGQERYTSMTRVYYRDAHGCAVMFDLTNRNSFLNVLKWKRDFDSKCVSNDSRPIPCLLIANKALNIHTLSGVDRSDVEGERAVSVEEIERLCAESHFSSWAEVSVKENQMVDDSMKYLISCILDRNTYEKKEKNGIKLNGEAAKSTYSEKKSCKCS